MGGKSRAKAPVNEELVSLIRATIGPREDVVEKRMFGGLCFLVDGKMGCGINGDDLMVRVSPAGFEAGLAEAHTRPMDFTGRPLRGFLYLCQEGWQDKATGRRWIQSSMDYVKSLPAKKPRARRVPGRVSPR